MILQLLFGVRGKNVQLLAVTQLGRERDFVKDLAVGKISTKPKLVGWCLAMESWGFGRVGESVRSPAEPVK